MKPYYLRENPNINGSLRWEQNSILRELAFKLTNVIEFLNSLESLLRPLCFYCVHYWVSKATMAACDCLTWPDAFFFFGGGTFLLNTWINYCYIAITPFNLAWILNYEWCLIYLVSNEPKISIVLPSVFNFFTERKIFSAVALIEIMIKALYLYYVFYIKFHSFLRLVMKL